MIIEKSIILKSTLDEVWKALTTPSYIERYLLGAEVVSGWTVGSEIIISGTYNGIRFKDVGKITVFNMEKEFTYTYWSTNHGTANTVENQVEISYRLIQELNGVNLKMVQSNYKSIEIVEGMDKIWDSVLSNLKSLLEKK